MNVRTLASRIGAMLLCFIISTVAFFSIACGPPSKKTIQKLDNAALIVVREIDTNITLPDQLLAEKIITSDQLATVEKYIAEARASAVKAEQGLAAALTVENPSLKTLAPIVADVIAQLRGLTSLVKHEKVQKFFSAVEIGLRVLGSYFALQISQARQAGFSDRQICEQAGLPYEGAKFNLLATAYDSNRFDEWAAVL